MELKFINENNQEAKITVSDTFFNRNYNEALVHQIVTSYLSNSRIGTSAQKGRSDIAKSTHKPWRQKGTGRARVGMASSPIWRGGGKIFPNSSDENFKKKINKKMYRGSISIILSQLIRDKRMLITERFDVDTHKTKELAEKLKRIGLNSVLIITDEISNNLYLSARNIPKVAVVEVGNIDPVNLLKFNKILVTLNGLRKVEEIFS